MLCSPAACCCLDTVSIKPGEIAPIWIDWSGWLRSAAGFKLWGDVTIVLQNNNVNPIVDALPAEIDTVPSLATPNVEHGKIVGDTTKIIVSVGAATALNRIYRMNVTVQARDCDGVIIQRTECLLFRITDCE